MEPAAFFTNPQNTVQKQYEALRAFYVEKCPGEEVAKRFGYTLSSFYSLTRDFKKNLLRNKPAHVFFTPKTTGRKPKTEADKIYQLIIDLRKKYLSVPDIKAIVDAQGQHTISESHIYNVINNEGFARLPRRNNSIREKAGSEFKIEAPKSSMLDFTPEAFSSQNSLGILCLLPYIQRYGIDRLILQSDYPETNTISKLSSILCFLGLKLSDVRRYSADDIWCMDRGLGLFAGLNVLPKTGWYTSYSHRVTRSMNRDLLKGLQLCFKRDYFQIQPTSTSRRFPTGGMIPTLRIIGLVSEIKHWRACQRC